MQKTVSIQGKDRTFATVTVDIAEKLQLASKSGLEFNKHLVLASLQAGGDTTTTIADIGKLSYFNAAEGSFNEFIQPTLEVNGLKAQPTGENQPGGPAAGTPAAE